MGGNRIDGSRIDERQALRNVEALLARSRKPVIIGDAKSRPLPIESVGIIGAGMMGVAIAAIHVRMGMPIFVLDADSRVLAGVQARVADELVAGKSNATTSSGGAHDTGVSPADIGRLVRPTSRLADVASCDLVIETIAENRIAKQSLYGELEPILSEKATLASNTSTIPIGQLAGRLARPERFCGMHFFHPVRERPLVEVIRGPASGDMAVATVAAHARAMGKKPVVVGDGPGFLVNRLLQPHLGEALDLLLDGVPIERIDDAATGFGMAKGPLRLLDEIGLDTALQGGLVLAGAFPERIVASPVLVAMVKRKHLGCKAGRGFYRYDATDMPSDTSSANTEEVTKLAEPWARPLRDVTDDEIVERLLLPMVVEATRVVEDGLVADVRDIDLSMILGLGFPTAKGGLLWWADNLGARRVTFMLESRPELGERGHPTDLLRRLAESGKSVYDLPVDAVSHRG